MPVPRITKEELKQRLDAGTPVVVVDARLKYPYEHSTVKLPGAVRVVTGGPVPALPRDREIVVSSNRVLIVTMTAFPPANEAAGATLTIEYAR